MIEKLSQSLAARALVRSAIHHFQKLRVGLIGRYLVEDMKPSNLKLTLTENYFEALILRRTQLAVEMLRPPMLLKPVEVEVLEGADVWGV